MIEDEFMVRFWKEDSTGVYHYRIADFKGEIIAGSSPYPATVVTELEDFISTLDWKDANESSSNS